VDLAAEPELGVWDVAALVPIIEGAGGMMTGFDGSPVLTAGSGLTSNGHLHEQARRVLGSGA
jgi:histidinol-phosphatase